MAGQDQNQTEIRKVFDALSDATRRRDLSAVLRCYAKDVVAFDVMPPLAVRGVDNYRKNWEAGFAATEGPFNLEYRDMNIVSSGDVAFVHALEHSKTTDKEDRRSHHPPSVERERGEAPDWGHWRLLAAIGSVNRAGSTP